MDIPADKTLKEINYEIDAHSKLTRALGLNPDRVGMVPGLKRAKYLIEQEADRQAEQMGLELDKDDHYDLPDFSADQDEAVEIQVDYIQEQK